MNFSHLEQFLQSLSNRYGIPGASCRIWHQHKEVFSLDVGVRDITTGKAMQGNEQIDFYSASKPVTAVAAMQLMEKGLLSPGDPVSHYFPAYAHTKVLDEAGNLQSLTSPITVGHMMSMTSGFTYDMYTPAIQKVKAEHNGELPTLAFAEAVAESPLQFIPGTRWLYNIGLDVTAALVEKISGMRFSEYVKTHIFEPLGMNASCYHPEEADPLRYVKCYDEKNGQLSPRERNGFHVGKAFESGGAGLISTADDYIRFVDALANGGMGATGERILQPATVNLMRLNRLTPAMRQDIPWAQCKGYGYGLGVRTLVDVAEAASLSPVGEFGWDGLKGAYLLADPEHQLALFYLEQTGMHKEYLHPRLRNLAYLGFSSEK